MRPRAALFPAILILVFGLAFVACQPKESQEEDPTVALWAEIEQMRTDLQAMRDELAALRATATEDGEEGEEADAGTDGDEAAEGAEGEAAPAMTEEELQAKIEEMEQRVADVSTDFYGKIVEYINKSGIAEGAELTPEQKKAFQWKAEQDVLIAQEYIDKGGDYARAIDILDAALLNDPENETLLTAKAEAVRLQFMDEERFSQVKKGMTQDEVLALLGNTHYGNKREYEDGTIGWFYRKEAGGAAGVFFREKRGEMLVATMDFNAAKPQGEDEE